MDNYDKETTLVGIILVITLIVAVVGGVASYTRTQREVNSCEKLGGHYKHGKGIALCIKDGYIIEEF